MGHRKRTKSAVLGVCEHSTIESRLSCRATLPGTLTTGARFGLGAKAIALSLLAVGCAHGGTGTGVLRVPVAGATGLQSSGPVDFRWQSDSNPSAGTIAARLPDGRLFSGQYVQPTTTEWRDNFGPYWGAWSQPWGAARPWYNGPRSSFVVHYNGKALAHLEAPDRTRMRCEFTLFQPSSGLAGGGQGDCQLSTNEEVFDAVLRQD
jgi:hypothetical protein